MLNIEKAFKVSETRLVPDWWGLGVVFELAWIGNREYQKWLEENTGDDPANRVLIDTMTKAATTAAVKVQGLRKGQNRRLAYQKHVDEAFERLIERADLSGVEFESLKPEGIARFIVRGIRGLTDVDPETGEETPRVYTPELGIELMEKTDPLTADLTLGAARADEWERNAEGLEDGIDAEEALGARPEPLFMPAGTPLGVALKKGWLWEASRGELYRQAFLEAAEKN